MDLKNIRKFLGLTQKEFADRMKLSRSQISAIEQGQRKVNDRLIMQISLVFGLSEKWIRTGEGEPYPEGKKEEDILTNDSFLNKLVKAYETMSDDEKGAFKHFLYSFGIIKDTEENAEDDKKIM